MLFFVLFGDVYRDMIDHKGCVALSTVLEVMSPVLGSKRVPLLPLTCLPLVGIYLNTCTVVWLNEIMFGSLFIVSINQSICYLLLFGICFLL